MKPLAKKKANENREKDRPLHALLRRYEMVPRAELFSSPYLNANGYSMGFGSPGAVSLRGEALVTLINAPHTPFGT